MKKLFVIFSLVFCVSGWSQSFRKIKLENTNDRMVVEAYQLSLSWIQNYRNTNKKAVSSDDLKNQLDLILQKSSLTTLGIEKEGISADACSLDKSGNAMYDQNGNRLYNYARMALKQNPIIYVCNFLIQTFHENIRAIAQILTHEYYHLWEYSVGFNDQQIDEDYATEFEVGIVLHNLNCVPFTSDYTKQIASKFNHRAYRSCN